MVRTFAIAALCVSWWVVGSTALLQCQEPADKKLQQLADESRTRAKAIVVSLTNGDKVEKATLHSEPLMKYTDVPRQIDLATLWVWQENGRPVAIGKVEAYRRAEGTKWLYCFASASSGLVEGAWPDGHQFHAKKPGVAWTALKAPAPHDAAAARLRQMKELFSRFSATSRDDLLKTSDDLRPLARPLWEYTSPKHDAIQGVLCGFAANGTNPDVLIALEAVGAADGTPKSWRYAVICMTASGITVKLDKIEVFTRPYAKSPADFETWTYFWEGAGKK